MSTHRERLVPPASWWLAGGFFAVVWGWLVFVIASLGAAILVVGVLGAAMACALWAYGGRVVIDAGPTGLRVARARLDPPDIGAVEVLDAAAMRRWHGTDADARAWLVHRAYVRTGVRVVVDDPADPTPYWLLSSRRPQSLADALAAPPPASPAQPDLSTTDRGGPHGQA